MVVVILLNAHMGNMCRNGSMCNVFCPEANFYVTQHDTAQRVFRPQGRPNKADFSPCQHRYVEFGVFERRGFLGLGR